MPCVNLKRWSRKIGSSALKKSAIDEAGGEAMRRSRTADGKMEGDRRARDVRNTCRIQPARALQHAGDADEGKGRPFRAAPGMHRVVDQKLENLDAAQPKNLVRKGYLARIYLHLLSLQNFGRLLDRNGRPA